LARYIANLELIGAAGEMRWAVVVFCHAGLAEKTWLSGVTKAQFLS
jgi:hypothetical protein